MNGEIIAVADDLTGALEVGGSVCSERLERVCLDSYAGDASGPSNPFSVGC
jgi:hypothetical protein